ncbi:hypothetical protein, partial [Bariatricus sp. HCP28S3_B6]|uniref:hypothetical protein n=1 Tax=Bariatricus sp. HCP28S3_B6 TaxID=3438896 RepID=UPI003F8864A1
AIIREIESRRTPDNGLYRLESDLLYEWEDMERTASLCEEMIKLGIADAATYYRLGYCNVQDDSLLQAYATTCKGLEAFPEDADLRYMKAYLGFTEKSTVQCCTERKQMFHAEHASRFC